MAEMLPPLPKTVHGLLGPITVSIVAEITAPEPGMTRMGEWSPVERRIRIRRDMSLDVQWATFYHEVGHSWLEDTGASHGLSDEVIERVCDVIGLARYQELAAKRTR